MSDVQFEEEGISESLQPYSAKKTVEDNTPKGIIAFLIKIKVVKTERGATRLLAVIGFVLIIVSGVILYTIFFQSNDSELIRIYQGVNQSQLK